LSSDQLPGGSVRDPTGAKADGPAYLAFSRMVNAAPGTVRVFRGGGWNARPGVVVATMRQGNLASLRERGLGFRVALAPQLLDAGPPPAGTHVQEPRKIQRQASTNIPGHWTRALR
jgi:hypothetical protein